MVRLKAGDPLLFGRAGEEIEALREAGVDYQIVPGITAAFGAAARAGIALTDRRWASKLVFLSNHQCAGKRVDWGALGQDGTTVVYMPGTGSSRAGWWPGASIAKRPAWWSRGRPPGGRPSRWRRSRPCPRPGGRPRPCCSSWGTWLRAL